MCYLGAKKMTRRTDAFESVILGFRRFWATVKSNYKEQWRNRTHRRQQEDQPKKKFDSILGEAFDDEIHIDFNAKDLSGPPPQTYGGV